jgi:hypothetical protein
MIGLLVSILSILLAFLHSEVIVDDNAAIWKGQEYPVDHIMAGTRIPFYMYSGGDFDVFWDNCDHIMWSKGVELSWLLRLREHPWRVKDPSEASLFVVPALFSISQYSLLFNESICRMPLDTMAERLYNALTVSPHYIRHDGADHIMVVSYFKAQLYLKKHHLWFPVTQKLNLATHAVMNGYIPRPKGKCQLTVGHQPGNININNYPQSLSPHRTLFFIGQAVHEPWYRERRAAIENLGVIGQNNLIVASDCVKQKGTKTHKAKLNLCQGGPDYREGATNCCLNEPLAYHNYLRQLVDTNFTLNIRGGDAGSSRTFDAILLGTPQIVISDAFLSHYAPFPCTVPWRKFVTMLVGPMKLFLKNPIELMTKTLEVGIPRRNQMKAIQDSHRRDLLWNREGSLSANNLLVEAVKRCLPKWPLTTNMQTKQDIKIVKTRKCS